MTSVVRPAEAGLWDGPRPVVETGEVCRFAVQLSGAPAVTYAPTAAGALTALMGEGYESLLAEDRRDARRSLAVELADRVQRRFVIAMGHTGDVDVLFGSKHQPVNVSAWLGPVPLVLVESWYAPVTNVQRPTGAVMWLRPEGEWDFAVSVADAGLARVGAAI